MMTDPWHIPRFTTLRLGSLLRERRQTAGLTQSELCKQIGFGLTPPNLSRIEAGYMIPAPAQAEAIGQWFADTRLQAAYSDDTPLVGGLVTPTPPRATHPDTSRKAMTAVNRANASRIHEWVIDRLTEHPEGATHEQLWMIYTRTQPEARTSQSGLRTRVSELVRGGVVCDTGRTRTMTTGRQAIVWALTESND